MGMTGYSLFSTYERSQLRTLNAVLAEQAGTALAIPLWNFDRAQIVRAAESIMKERSVYAIVVRKAGSGEILLSLTRTPEWNVIRTDNEVSSGRLLRQEQNIEYFKEAIGKVQVFVTPRFLEEQLATIRVTIFCVIAGVAAILTMTLYLLLWRIVIKPIKILEQFALGAHGEKEDNSRIQTVVLYGELDSLRSSFIKMVTLLETRFIELQQETKRFCESESRFRTLVNTIPDLIWLKNTDGVYLSANKMFERFFGASEADIAGKTDYDFVDKDLADSFRENDRKAIASGKPHSNEEWITFSDDGHQALLDTTKTPMYDGENNLIGVLGIGRDITGRKKTEEALHLQTVELEEEVAERQAAQENLQKKALLLEEEIGKRQQAQEELERLNNELEHRVRERTAELEAKSGELEQKNQELERFNKLFVGRELRMVELKGRIKELETNISEYHDNRA